MSHHSHSHIGIDPPAMPVESGVQGKTPENRSALAQEVVMRTIISAFQHWFRDHLDQWGIEPSDSQQETFLTNRLPEILGIYRVIETQGVSDIAILRGQCVCLVATVMHEVQMRQRAAMTAAQQSPGVEVVAG